LWVFGVVVVVGLGASILSGIVAAIFSLGHAGFVAAGRGGEANFALAALGNTVGAAVSGSLLGVMSGVVYAVRAMARPPAGLALPDRAVPVQPSPEPESDAEPGPQPDPQ
jgi:hypothetical protein